MRFFRLLQEMSFWKHIILFLLLALFLLLYK